eukprot:CAMPEP_0203671452 /NCGR_PEP_ID=MMETSP0090-20130426/7234_1 /ASSEMBLY_ACC=CAM_ASM_001088 /TAXON_ID=426623 /ORGANISM="Chaetoceros affinis, Strain CCMP159" /LENGTH=650 /DNA_ID=CAMNT_0050536529 /DNA_START=481 /DNA_END=2433 /DNA_ORIENTATION=+
MYDPSTSVDTANSGSHYKYRKLNSTIRDIIKTTNAKTPAVGVVDHHRQLKNKNDSSIYRQMPPIHRTYVVQAFFIVPMIVIPISILKYISSKLSSRKSSTRGYYDSDDDDDDHLSRRRHQQHRRHGDNSDSSIWDDLNSSFGAGGTNHSYNGSNDENDNFNDVYIKIHVKVQNQVNKSLDVVWNHTPTAQFLICFFAITSSLYLGMKFYTMTGYSASLGSKSFFKSNSRFANYNNPRMNNFQQPYPHPHNRYPGGPMQPPSAGMQSTTLNAELMAKRFEMKQKLSGVGIGGSEFYRYYGVKVFLDQINKVAEKLGLESWTSSFYSPWGMIYMVSIWGIITSLCLFGRIMLPLPDLIAGGRDTWSGRGGNKSHKQKRKEKIWPESYMSITTSNKFSLYAKILLIRIVENLIVCAILPQSLYVCKATGHCNVEPTIFEIGNPTAIHRGYNLKGNRSMFDNLIQDRFAGYVIGISVVMISALVLLGQIVVLDKSSLSLEAYNCIQGSKRNSHKLNDGHSGRKGGGGKRSSSANSHDTNSFWNDNNGSGGNGQNNEKKRNVLSDVRNFVYRTFSLELGALSTSRILSFIFTVYTVHVILVVIFAMFYSLTGRDWYPLVLTLVAIFTAAGGSDVDTADFDELESIASEINAMHGM